MVAPEQSPELIPANKLNRLLLENAWRLFCIYDRTSIDTQKRFLRFRTAILGLVVAATTLAVLKSTFWSGIAAVKNITDVFTRWDGFLYGLVVITPILVSVLLVASVKFDRGMNWVLLRASAEVIKKEIYCYRTIGIWLAQDADMSLAQAIQVVGDRLMKTQVNRSSFALSKSLEIGSADLVEAVKNGISRSDVDPFSQLSVQQYIDYRLVDQLSWYRRKTVVLDRQWEKYQWLIYVFGGLGTFLAATGVDLWIAVTNAIASALTSFLDFKQLDTTLVSYNQAACNLESLLCWWHALSDTARQDQGNIKKLVLNTEKVIEVATSSWVQEMSEALTKLYKEDEKEPPSGDRDDSGSDNIQDK
jgi:uncharacterized membrane protein